MAKFDNKIRYTLGQIIRKMILVNCIVFANLILMRSVYEYIYDSSGYPLYASFTWFFAIAMFVVAGFELRLIDGSRRRVLGVETKVDYIGKWIAIGLFVLVAYLSDNNKAAQIAVLSGALVAAILWDVCIYVRNRASIGSIIVDWTDVHRDKTIVKDSGIRLDRATKYDNMQYMVLSLLLVVFANNTLVSQHDSTLAIVLLAISAIGYVGYVLTCLIRLGSANMLNIASLIASVAVICSGYFVHDNLIQWAGFLVGFVVASIPLTILSGRIARHILRTRLSATSNVTSNNLDTSA